MVDAMPVTKTNVIKIDATHPEDDRIAVAAEVIRSGGIVVFPTETVYGIGASAFDENACRRIFEVKGRPADNPLIVHVSSLEMADKVAHIPEEYRVAIGKAWPSPITFIAKARAGLPNSVTAGLDTVAVRMPAHKVALSLIEKSGVPIAAPSANPSGRPSATSGEQCVKYFNGLVECIVDSGRAFFGMESTIIDLRDFTMLRPGAFTVDEIKGIFGKVPKIDDVARGLSRSDKPISPGTKYTHYAPSTPIFLFSGKIEELASIIDSMGGLLPFAFIGSKESCLAIENMGYSAINLGSRGNMYDIAKNLYGGLILVDSMNVYFGIVESFDETGVGLALMNRIRKASSNRTFSNAEKLAELIDSV